MWPTAIGAVVTATEGKRVCMCMDMLEVTYGIIAPGATPAAYG